MHVWLLRTCVSIKRHFLAGLVDLLVRDHSFYFDVGGLEAGPKVDNMYNLI